MTLTTPYETYLGEVVNRSKFHSCTPSTFGGVKQQAATPQHGQTELLFKVYFVDFS